MVSALVSTPLAHTHRAWPTPGTPWCWACSAMVDFAVVLADHLKEQEA
jgi:hypothetical protein